MIVRPKSVHTGLVHSCSDLCSKLCSDCLDRPGERRFIIEVGELVFPGTVQVEMCFDIGHQV
jgi:hypothetical protein